MDIISLIGSDDFIDPVLLSLKVLLFIIPALALCGIPLGVFLGRRNGWGAAAADFIVSLPLVLPPIATGFVLLVLLGRQGLLGGFFYRFSEVI